MKQADHDQELHFFRAVLSLLYRYIRKTGHTPWGGHVFDQFHCLAIFVGQPVTISVELFLILISREMFKFLVPAISHALWHPCILMIQICLKAARSGLYIYNPLLAALKQI